MSKISEEEILQVLKYYKGEKKNPFDNDKQNTKYQYWEYEASFYHKFKHGDFGNLPPKEALHNFLDALFIHLADKYEAMDNGAGYFRKLYENG